MAIPLSPNLDAKNDSIHGNVPPTDLFTIQNIHNKKKVSLWTLDFPGIYNLPEYSTVTQEGGAINYGVDTQW